jgi:serine protease Do
MKTIYFITLTAWFTAMTVFAIEAPPDDAPPPGEVSPPATASEAPPVAAGPVENDAVAYLGVVSTAVPEMLAEHLGLKPGEGIVVRALMPDGPAAKAGLAVHDVISRVGDKPVGSSEELTARIAARKPGDTIRLDVIHQGKAAGLDVTLGSRPEHLGVPMPGALDQLNLDGMPKDFADRVRGMIEGNLGELKLDFENGLDEAAPQVEDAMRQMRERMGQAMDGLKVPQIPQVPQQGGIEIHQGATLRLMDEQGSVELKSREGGKEITVRDKDQSITWSGPWDTEQDKAAAPEDIRHRVERLDVDSGANGLRLRFRNVPQVPGE